MKQKTVTEAEKHAKKSGSKKSKKGWRLRTDIQDIEDHLVEKRTEERHGGIVAEKSDIGLFFVDGAAEENVSTQKTKQKLIIPSDDEDEEVYVSRRDRQKKKLQLERDGEMKENTKAATVVNIWGQEAMAVTNSYLESTVKPTVLMPSTMKKAVTAPTGTVAVDVDPSGASYNPNYDDHQELLKVAHERELQKLTNRKKLNKKVKMVSVGQLKKLSKIWLQEMSAGLKNEAEPPAEENEAVNTEAVVGCPVSAEDRKTMKARKRLLRERQAIRRTALDRGTRMKLQDVYRLKSLKREIKIEETARSQRREHRSALLAERQRRPKRLSKHKFGEGDTVVQLSEEISGSLRGLRVEGSLAEDRFRSLQRRNIIETRRPVVPHRKYKKKTFEKHSYKTKTIKELTHKNEK